MWYAVYQALIKTIGPYGKANETLSFIPSQLEKEYALLTSLRHIRFLTSVGKLKVEEEDLIRIHYWAKKVQYRLRSGSIPDLTATKYAVKAFKLISRNEIVTMLQEDNGVKESKLSFSKAEELVNELNEGIEDAKQAEKYYLIIIDNKPIESLLKKGFKTKLK